MLVLGKKYQGNKNGVFRQLIVKQSNNVKILCLTTAQQNNSREFAASGSDQQLPILSRAVHSKTAE